MTLVLISAALYIVATGLLAAALRMDPAAPSPGWRLPAFAAMAAHAAVHAIGWRVARGPELSFFAALSLVGLGMAAATTLVATRERVTALAIFALPVAASLLLVHGLQPPVPPKPLDWQHQLHATLALLAYATLALAALVAVTVWLQDRALRRRELGRWLRALPPLVQFETLLFRTIAVGFALLTAALLTGLLFVEDLLAQHLVHKTVLSVLSWIAFGTLLVGRRRYGWRGAKAVRWTLAAMALLVLAYFGTKFVLEIVRPSE
jgi:ABC-type uncharacterized transport system permease subunit